MGEARCFGAFPARSRLQRARFARGGVTMGGGGIEAQTERVLRNLAAVLEAGGASTGSVVQTTVYLVDLADFPAMNGVYGSFFPENPPARATVQVAKLPAGARVEIDAVASVE